MKSARERMDMHAAYKELGCYRAAAELCGTTDKTLKRAVARATAAEETPGTGAAGHNYDDVATVSTERIEKTKGKITAKRILSTVRAAGSTGSARNLRRAVADAKVTWRIDRHRGRRHPVGPDPVHGDDRRGPQDPVDRPHGVLDGDDGGRAGRADAGPRALRHPLRHPAGLLTGSGPRIQGHRRAPRRLREV
ncbi:MAG: hypothetical protein ACYDHU_09900 [Acidimicrobiales bacterium]